MTIARPHMRHHVLPLLVLGMNVAPVAADVQIFETEDQAAWFDAAGSWDTVDFTGFPSQTVIRDQYADLGVLFTSTDVDFIRPGPGLFLQDDWGLGGEESVEITLTAPRFGFASHFPGEARFSLFLGDEIVYDGSDEEMIQGGSGADFFVGFLSDVPFDRIFINGRDPNPFVDRVSFDNFYFAPIPAPGALALFGLAGVSSRRRRR